MHPAMGAGAHGHEMEEPDEEKNGARKFALHRDSRTPWKYRFRPASFHPGPTTGVVAHFSAGCKIKVELTY